MGRIINRRNNCKRNNKKKERNNKENTFENCGASSWWTYIQQRFRRAGYGDAEARVLFYENAV